MSSPIVREILLRRRAEARLERQATVPREPLPPAVPATVEKAPAPARSTVGQSYKGDAQIARRLHCAVCHWEPHWRFPGVLESHHIVPRRAGGGNERSNLILLCANHHRLAHAMFPRSGDIYHGPTDRVELIAALSDPDAYYEEAQARILSLLR